MPTSIKQTVESNRRTFSLVGVIALVVLVSLFAANRNTHQSFLKGPTPASEDDAEADQYMSFDEFTDLYVNAKSFLLPKDRVKVDQYVRDNKMDDHGHLFCHRVDRPPTRELPSVPIPKAWCERGADAPKTYLWLIGDAFSGTTGTLSMLINAKNISSLCEFKDGEPYRLCEGLKYVAPASVLEHRLQDYWPEDFKKDVIDPWEKLWRDPEAPFRMDKSPPWAIKAGQIINDLKDKYNIRVAFLILTRSRCSTHRTEYGFLDRFAMYYEYCLRRGIPVMHLRYEDFPAGIERIKGRLLQWAPCISVPASTGFEAFMEAEGVEMDETHSGRGRYTAIETYLAHLTPADLQQPREKQLPAKFVPAEVYFGYSLAPMEDTEPNT